MNGSMKRMREIGRALDEAEKTLDSLCNTATRFCTALHRAVQLSERLPSLDELNERAAIAERLSLNLGQVAKRD